jgi:hypothetical protein
VKPAATAIAAAAAALLAGCARTDHIAAPAAATPVTQAAGATELRAPRLVNGIGFVDVAEAVGLDYRWPQQPRPMRNKEAFGAGCAFLDYDDDGWQDVLLVGSRQVALYRNVPAGAGNEKTDAGARRFVNVTRQTGLNTLDGDDFIGCAVGDYDGDGRLDLLLTGYHRLALLRNEQSRRFADVTTKAGLDARDHDQWGSSAGFMDLDGDNRLDLVVLHYVVFGPNEKQYCELTPGVRSGCPPNEYRPEFAEVWQNKGDGTFQNVSAQAGMKNTSGKALVLAFAHLDDDNRMDLYIGNDTTPAELLLNRSKNGQMRFDNVGAESGVAYGPGGEAIAAMGADWADYDGDGRFDLAVTAFSGAPYSLFRALEADVAIFEDSADATGLSGPTTKPLGFGAKWLDMDNDGWTDLSFTNGHVYDNVRDVEPGSEFRQPLMLFRNEPVPGQGRRTFRDLVPLLGGDLARPLLGRGSAAGDFDNDGRTDLLVVDYEGAPLLLRNVSRTSNHWLTLDLRGSRGGPNRFAYGARVTARAGARTWVAHVAPASSYLSSSDPRIHLGLGAASHLDSLVIRWPSGRRQTLQNVPADRLLVITEDPKAGRPR